MGWRLEAQGQDDLHLLVDGMRVEPQVRGFVTRIPVRADAGEGAFVLRVKLAGPMLPRWVAPAAVEHGVTPMALAG